MEQNASGTADVLDFSSADSSFDVLGPSVSVSSGDEVVIDNLGVSGLDAWAGDVNSTVSSSGSLSSVSFASKKFPMPSSAGKFFVVSGPVSWVCDPVAKTMTRYSGYQRQSSQPVSVSSPPLSSASSSLASKDVSSCSFAASQATSSRNGIVSLLVSLSKNGESITLLGETYVPSSP